MNDKEVINGYGKPIYLYYSNNQINNTLFRKYVDFLLSNVEVDSSKMIKIRNEICYISKYLKETETTNVTDIVQRDFDTYTIKVRYELEKGHAVIKHLHNFFDFLYKNGYMNHEIICNNGTIKICDIDDLFRKKHKGCGYRKSIKYTSVKNKEALDILYSFAKGYLLPQNLSYSYTYQIMCQAKDFCNFFRGRDLRKLIERDFYDYNSLLLNFPRSTKNNMYLYSTYFTHYLIRFYSYDNIELLDEIIDFKIKYSNYSKDISFNIPYLLCDRNITYDGFNRLREYIKYLCTLDLSSNIIVLRMRAASFVETNSKESKDNASLSHKMAVNIKLYKEYAENGKYISYGFDSTGKRKNPFVFTDKKMVLIGNNSYECIVPNKLPVNIEKVIINFCNYQTNIKNYKKRTILGYINKLVLFFEIVKINRIEELTDEMVSMFVEYVKEYSNNIYKISLSVLASFFDYLYDNAITQKRFVIHERIYVYTKKLIDGNNKYPFINISEYFSINDSPRFNKFDKRKIIHFELLNYQSNFELIYEWSIFQCKNGYCGFNLLQHKINTICAFSNYISKKWCEISREDFLRYKKHLFDKNYKIETINEKIRPLLEFVLWGVSKGKDINNFTEKHDLEKRNYIKANNDISMYNLQQLFYHLPEIREDVRIMIIIMMQTGMRQSEVSHLEYDCVYEFNDSFYIKYYSSKGKKYNTNIISKKLYEIISIYKENSENPNRKYLFSSQFGNVISGDVMNAELKRIIEDNDLKDETGKKLKITNHCFRHTVAELLRDNGASPYVIKEVLHHDAIDMTYKYVNSSKDKIIARYNSLSSEAKGETELSDNFVPEKYSVNDVNNKLIEILLYGSCSRNKKIGKCKDSPSECYMCSHFNYDEEYYNSYIDQYNRVSSLIMVYIKNTIEVPDNLLNLKLKLEEIIQSIQKQCSCNKKGIEKANEKFI